jgi:hypothetical protein
MHYNICFSQGSNHALACQPTSPDDIRAATIILLDSGMHLW